MKFRPLFFLISFSLLAVSTFSLYKWGFKPSIDFAGGTVYEVKIPATDKTGDTRRITHHTPALVSHPHLNQDITRQYFLGHCPPLPVLNLNLVLSRYHYLQDFASGIHELNALL